MAVNFHDKLIRSLEFLIVWFKVQALAESPTAKATRVAAEGRLEFIFPVLICFRRLISVFQLALYFGERDGGRVVLCVFGGPEVQ